MKTTTETVWTVARLTNDETNGEVVSHFDTEEAAIEWAKKANAGLTVPEVQVERSVRVGGKVV